MAVARLAVVLAFLPGCFWFSTKHEGDVLRRDVGELEHRVGSQERVMGDKVKQLDESLDKATRLLARNSADLGTQVEKTADEVATLQAQNETLRRDIDGLREEIEKQRAAYEARLGTYAERMELVEKQLAAMVAAKQTTPPAADKDQLYADAQKKLAAGQYADARKDLRTFVQKFGQDAKADDAQYLIGEAFQKEKEFEKSIAEFQRVIDSYPNGDVVDDAFLAAGMSALEMKWCVDAGAYLGELIRRYPQSTLVKQAKDKLAHIKKNAKNKAVCQT